LFSFFKHGFSTTSWHLSKPTYPLLRAEAETNGLSYPIIIAGSLVDDQVCRYVGADYWVSDAMDGVRLCQKLMEKDG
jgi:hypothetical protein